jgi:hypothetical protein
MAAWVGAEAPHYDYAAPSYGDAVGHFTQARLLAYTAGWERHVPMRVAQLLAVLGNGGPRRRSGLQQDSESLRRCHPVCNPVCCHPVSCLSAISLFQSAGRLGGDDGGGVRPGGRLRGGRRPRCRVGAGAVRVQVRVAGQRTERRRVRRQRAPAGGPAVRQQRLKKKG